MASDPPPPKFPVAPNLSQILNRISLGLAKHERILQTLKRPPLPQPTASSAQPTASRSGFSSLAAAAVAGSSSSSSSRPAPPTGSGGVGGGRGSRAEEEEALFERDRALPPNAGVGFVEERKVGESRAGGGAGREEKMLRGRLLGRRVGADKGDGGKEGLGRKRRAAEMEESEEEEGRSGLGKVKKKSIRTRATAVDVEGEDGGALGNGGKGAWRGERADDTGSGGDASNGAEETVSVVEVAATAGEPQQQRDADEDQAGVLGDDAQAKAGVPTAGDAETVDAAELAREKKKRRKQAKRKRSRANKAQETADTVETAEATPDEA